MKESHVQARIPHFGRVAWLVLRLIYLTDGIFSVRHDLIAAGVSPTKASPSLLLALSIFFSRICMATFDKFFVSFVQDAWRSFVQLLEVFLLRVSRCQVPLEIEV